MCGKISPFDLQQIKLFETSSFSNRQQHCAALSCQNKGTREPNVPEIKQINLAVSLETPDHNYCRVTPNLLQRQSRLTVVEPVSSHQNGDFAQKYFNKSVTGECSKYICLHLDCITSYASTLLWMPDPLSQWTDVLQQIWCNQFL